MSVYKRDSDINRNEGIAHDKKEKGRNVQRACDGCRRKKTRCDGSRMPLMRCTNCVVNKLDCTYVEAAKKRGPPKSYVESVENRVAKLQQLIGKIAPDALGKLENDLASDLPARHIDRTSPPSREPSQPVILPFIHAFMNTLSLSGDDEPDNVMLRDNLPDISLGRAKRFFGKSSATMLHQTTLRLKYNYITNNPSSPLPEFPPTRQFLLGAPNNVTYSFPDDDLMQSLLGLYFDHQNIFYPVFHRPTFEKSVADGLHLSNKVFAEILLVVCAIASRSSDDPRVLPDDVTSSLARGWKWFCQVSLVTKSLLDGSTTEDLQFYCLISMYFQGSSILHACWRLAGVGLRLAQDIGAHRRKPHTAVNPEDETQKRAFWTLVSLDRTYSACLGRACTIQDEEYDVDLPTECDDEYWDHPDPQQRFKQPADKPSVLTYFLLQIKLHRILAFALRTIYSVSKSKILLGFADQAWEEHIVGEIDSALNQFIDCVPDHLRWDPNREPGVFFEQSASLYSTYYYIQILVHRPFIPSPNRPISLPFPSLAISTNAARSCSRLTAVLLQRSTVLGFRHQISAFFAAIVLLLNIWSGKYSTDSRRDMEYVHKCMDVLKASEHRLNIAGRLWDLLNDLASVGDMPLPERSSLTNKRERDHDKESSLTSIPLPSATIVDNPTTQSLSMSRNVVIPDHPDSSSAAVGAGLGASSRPLPFPQQRVQNRTPPQRSQLLSQHIAPQQPSQHAEHTPPSGSFILSNTEVDQRLLHYQSIFRGQQETATYGSNAPHWYPVTGQGDGMSSSVRNDDVRTSVGSTPDIQQVDPQYMTSIPFGMGSEFLYDTTAPQYPGDSYARSQVNDTIHHYTSAQPLGSIDATTVNSPQYYDPPMPPRYAGYAPSSVQRQQSMRESDMYGILSTVPNGLEWDDWAHYMNMGSMAYGRYSGASVPVEGYY